MFMNIKQKSFYERGIDITMSLVSKQMFLSPKKFTYKRI